MRRRFWPNAELQRLHRLSNITLRTEFPPTSDASHGNGVLSLAYFGLLFRPLARHLVPEVVRQTHLGNGTVDHKAHLHNIARDISHIASFFPNYIYRRYIKRSRTHGFFERSALDAIVCAIMPSIYRTGILECSSPRPEMPTACADLRSTSAHFSRRRTNHTFTRMLCPLAFDRKTGEASLVGAETATGRTYHLSFQRRSPSDRHYPDGLDRGDRSC